MALLILATGVGATCEQQDFIEIPEVLEVSASRGVVAAPLQEPIRHDVIARHALDYRVENTSDVEVELVVAAQSLVNGVPRARGRAVHRLEPGQAAQGRISDLELQFGNELDVALLCCSASTCPTGEVLCPDEVAVPVTPAVCLDGCRDQASCVAACGMATSCGEACLGDAACESVCPLEPTCVAACESQAVGCAASCLALYGRCVDSVESPLVTVPCGLCEGESGLCTVVGARDSGVVLVNPAGATKKCAPPCAVYPGICMAGCVELHADAEQARSCLSRCIGLFQEYCGRDPTAIDLTVQVPCCYSQQCEGRLEAVAKLAAVECFEDSECGSQRRCNAQGRCENRVRDEQTGCAIGRLRASPGWSGCLWLSGVLFAAAWRGRRRAMRWGLWCGVALALTWPGLANSEPRGFRRTRSSFTAGVSTGTFFLGSVGEATQLGVGMVFQETLQSGYWGGSVRLGAAIYPTTQEDLPFDEGLQLYTLAAGPRFSFPTFDAIELLVFLQPEYEFVGVQSNALVRSTGAGGLHSLGAWMGVTYLSGSLVLELDAGAAWVLGVDAARISGALSVGLVGNL